MGNCCLGFYNYTTCMLSFDGMLEFSLYIKVYSDQHFVNVCLQVNAFRAMMHDNMMVGAFSHSTAVGKLRKDLPDVPTNARVMFPRYALDEAAVVSHYYLRYVIKQPAYLVSYKVIRSNGSCQSGRKLPSIFKCLQPKLQKLDYSFSNLGFVNDINASHICIILTWTKKKNCLWGSNQLDPLKNL